MCMTNVTASFRTAQAESLNRSNPNSNARIYCRTGTFFCCTNDVHNCKQCCRTNAVTSETCSYTKIERDLIQ